jgi:diguanylate cyclase (GGDEF)-like protein
MVGMSTGPRRPPGDAPPTVPKPDADAPGAPSSRVLPRLTDEETYTSTDVTEKLRTRARKVVVDRAILTVLSGPRPGRVMVLDREMLVVGRSRSADEIIDDPGVSREHVRITRHMGLLHMIEDLESSNGSFVNGKRVSQRALEDGDRIQLGPNILLRFTKASAAESELQARLYTGATTDSLTGLANREFALRQLEAEIAYCRRHRADVAVVMMDVDHFKEINDRYGHPAGDMLLTELATRLHESCRLEDVVARFGGEEFLLILRGNSVADAVPLAERIRRAVEETVVLGGGGAVQVTASFGVAALSEHVDGDVDALIQRADARLYAAKRGGRNRVVAVDE